MTVYKWKTTCSAMGCQRYTKRLPGPNYVYLCPAHWKMVPDRLKRLEGKARRRVTDTNADDHHEVWWYLWRKCVAAANKNFGMPI